MCFCFVLFCLFVCVCVLFCSVFISLSLDLSHYNNLTLYYDYHFIFFFSLALTQLLISNIKKKQRNNTKKMKKNHSKIHTFKFDKKKHISIFHIGPKNTNPKTHSKKKLQNHIKTLYLSVCSPVHQASYQGLKDTTKNTHTKISYSTYVS